MHRVHAEGLHRTYPLSVVRPSIYSDSYPLSTPVLTILCAAILGRAADLQVGAAQPHRRGPPA